MKRGKRQSRINIHFTNRWLYTFIAIGILASVGFGVYAATYSASGAGHPYTEISTCGANQILKMNSAGNAWTCVDSSETKMKAAVFRSNGTFIVPEGVKHLKITACSGGGGGGGTNTDSSGIGGSGGITSVKNAAKGVDIITGTGAGGQPKGGAYTGYGGVCWTWGAQQYDIYIQCGKGEMGISVIGQGKGGYGGGSYFGATTGHYRAPGTAYRGADAHDTSSISQGGGYCSGGSGAQTADVGAGGGAGGVTVIKYLDVEPGDILTMTVGAGGAGGAGTYPGGKGGNGTVVIEY